ncbi:MAG: SDR family oxidoreductase [Pseudomonadota bacterium]
MKNRRTKRLSGKRHVLVTGASSGIGKGFAEEYAKLGFHIALTARREERLTALAMELEQNHGVKTLIIPADLSEEGAADRVLNTVEEAGWPVEILVNNAGFGISSKFAETDWDAQRDFLSVLLNVPVELSHKVLPGMIDRGFGRIINIASIMGHLPGTAGFTLYGPTKTFLIRFSEALWSETAGTGVNVTAVCPGFTDSEFFDAAERGVSAGRVPKVLWMTPNQVAAYGIEAAEARQSVIVPGHAYKATAALFKLLPDPVSRRIMRTGSRWSNSTG